MCYVHKEGQNIVYKDELTIKEQAECKNNLLEVVLILPPKYERG